jgi:hypothetical protein
MQTAIEWYSCNLAARARGSVAAFFGLVPVEIMFGLCASPEKRLAEIWLLRVLVTNLRILMVWILT